MRQIIPFKKEFLFDTKVSEVTSISLEHSLSLKNDDCVSGSFQISGEYKMTASSINREKFNFDLPFEIELDREYVSDTIVVDIDNFYYEVVNDEVLVVNIDVFLEGEVKEKEEVIVDKEIMPTIEKEVVREEVPREDVIVEDKEFEDDINVSNDFNLFENIDNSDTYVTYHVYIVKEGDSLDMIMDKYGVSKEDISLYNNIEEIGKGTKLIIPSYNE